MQQKSVCFDTETTGIDPISAEIVGLSFSFGKGQLFMSWPMRMKEKTVQDFKEFFESDKH
jgi:DNA polymerase-1